MRGEFSDACFPRTRSSAALGSDLSGLTNRHWNEVTYIGGVPRTSGDNSLRVKFLPAASASPLGLSSYAKDTNQAERKVSGQCFLAAG